MKLCFISPILAELASEMDIELHVDPRYGYVGQLRLPNGTTRYFRSTVFDLNGAGATEVAKDKDYASFFLSKLGYPVPTGDSFHTERWYKAIGSDRTPERGWEYAQTLGLPVIVKPNSKSQGAGVALVHTKEEFFEAVEHASHHERVFLVQKPVVGKDYRIVVLDGEVISAYERIPLTVTGDGTSTILQLLREKQKVFEETKRDTIINPNDPRIISMLRRKNYSLTSILEAGTSVILLPNANLSTGGDAIDVTPEIHRDWKELAAKIAHDMNLRYIGIDIMTEVPLSERPAKYTVIEVNAAPGLDNYAAIGEKQNEVVRELYRKVLLALVA
jgi:D-alanine-D-alanine ligase-like ATP-grasp enzyme